MADYSDFSGYENNGFSDDCFAEIPFDESGAEDVEAIFQNGEEQAEPAPRQPEIASAPMAAPAPAQPPVAAPAAEPAASAGQPDNAAIEEENRKRAEHEAAEAQRKAAFEARQAEKKKAYDEQLAKMNSLSDDDVMMAAAQRAGQDTEKITRRNMKEFVSEYIQTLCFSDPAFARLTMHPRKSMICCFQYISRKAWEYIQDELKASGIQPGPGMQAYGTDIPDDLCYQWAEDYFRDPTVKEDEEQEEKFVPKPFNGKSTVSSKAKKPAEKKKAEKKPTPKKPEPKKPTDEGQLSFGQMAMV